MPKKRYLNKKKSTDYKAQSVSIDDIACLNVITI